VQPESDPKRIDIDLVVRHINVTREALRLAMMSFELAVEAMNVGQSPDQECRHIHKMPMDTMGSTKGLYFCHDCKTMIQELPQEIDPRLQREGVQNG